MTSKVQTQPGLSKNHCLQRLFIQLSNINYSIERLHGKSLLTADALSRAPLPSTEFINEDETLHDKISNIFVLTNLAEEAGNLDKIENVYLAVLQS